MYTRYIPVIYIETYTWYIHDVCLNDLESISDIYFIWNHAPWYKVYLDILSYTSIYLYILVYT
jgi:hypothetical protein